jgi:DNA-binding NarL/FixJ family response regulator
VLADDSLLIRTGVEAILELEPEIDVVATASSLDELLSAVDSTNPDVVVTDVRMPPTGSDEGIRAAVTLQISHPNVGVLVLSQFAQPDFLQQVFANGTGRRGYLLKDSLGARGELVRAIQTVAEGGSFIDPSVVSMLVTQHRRKPASPLDRLTDRERETLELVAVGRSNQGIGDALCISHRAVEKHINSIFAKLDLFEDSDANRRVLAVLAFLESR